MGQREIKVEVVRMVKLGKSIYFHQTDVCRILNLIKDGCQSINAKADLQEAVEIFSCIIDE